MANQNLIDLSRLQKLVFTTSLVIVYIALAWKGFSSPSLLGKTSGRIDLPVLDSGFVWLLVISNGAYLASKATPKTLVVGDSLVLGREMSIDVPPLMTTFADVQEPEAFV